MYWYAVPVPVLTLENVDLPCGSYFMLHVFCYFDYFVCVYARMYFLCMYLCVCTFPQTKSSPLPPHQARQVLLH